MKDSLGSVAEWMALPSDCGHISCQLVLSVRNKIRGVGQKYINFKSNSKHISRIKILICVSFLEFIIQTTDSFV